MGNNCDSPRLSTHVYLLFTELDAPSIWNQPYVYKFLSEVLVLNGESSGKRVLRSPVTHLSSSVAAIFSLSLCFRNIATLVAPSFMVNPYLILTSLSNASKCSCPVPRTETLNPS